MKTNLSRRFRKALSAMAILTLATLTGGMSHVRPAISVEESYPTIQSIRAEARHR